MGKLQKTTLLRYIAVILLVAVLIALQIFRKKQSPPARQETQDTASESAGPEIATGEKLPLKILYVGMTGTERQKDIISFLSANFQQVETVDLYAFKEEQTSDSDVIILDKDGIQWGGRGDRPLRDYPVSNQYSRPTISLGIPGAFWTDRMRLKTGYM